MAHAHRAHETSAAAKATTEQRAQEQGATISQLRQAISMLDNERDALVSEVDQKTEDLHHADQQLQHALHVLADRDVKEQLMLQESGRHTKLRAQAEDERDSLRSQLDALVCSDKDLRQEVRSREAELSATSQDLRKMIHENQVVNAEIQGYSVETNRLRAQLDEARAHVARLEQAGNVREREVEELLDAYRRLSDEAHASQAASTQLGVECDRLRMYARSLELESEAMLGHMEGVLQEG